MYEKKLSHLKFRIKVNKANKLDVPIKCKIFIIFYFYKRL